LQEDAEPQISKVCPFAAMSQHSIKFDSGCSHKPFFDRKLSL